eukprot:TRINITY_DN1872_c0_g1_i2.p1 TRINITY_DN1872_c0_g1~~TRINITY_DN1872_c0_g1_i2.p1  ORF type:complete len:316 (-),score=90.42 TRINITY_DN1872_c0_g1_i2:16-963(-)
MTSIAGTSSTQFRLHGKRILVTGASRGIGRRIASRLLDWGAMVAASDYNSQELSTAESILLSPTTTIATTTNNPTTPSPSSSSSSSSPITDEWVQERKKRLLCIRMDVSDESSVKSGIETVVQNWGGLDVVVNNAARTPDFEHPKSVADLPLEEWNAVIATNLTGPFLTTKHAVPYLSSTNSDSSTTATTQQTQQRKGRIINIASTRAFQSEANTESYSASKGGLIALTHSLAVSLGPRGVLVNSISPGWIHATAEEDYHKLGSLAHSQHPAGRVGLSDDIAAMVGFLSSDDSTFITGQNYTVDGGMTKKMIYLE